MEETPYCEECLFFEEAPYRCSHGSNRTSRPNTNSWLSRYEGFDYTEHPAKKNENNKCEDFKPYK